VSVIVTLRLRSDFGLFSEPWRVDISDVFASCKLGVGHTPPSETSATEDQTSPGASPEATEAVQSMETVHRTSEVAVSISSAREASSEEGVAVAVEKAIVGTVTRTVVQLADAAARARPDAPLPPAVPPALPAAVPAAAANGSRTPVRARPDAPLPPAVPAAVPAAVPPAVPPAIQPTAANGSRNSVRSCGGAAVAAQGGSGAAGGNRVGEGAGGVGVGLAAVLACAGDEEDVFEEAEECSESDGEERRRDGPDPNIDGDAAGSELNLDGDEGDEACASDLEWEAGWEEVEEAAAAGDTGAISGGVQRNGPAASRDWLPLHRAAENLRLRLRRVRVLVDEGAQADTGGVGRRGDDTGGGGRRGEGTRRDTAGGRRTSVLELRLAELDLSTTDSQWNKAEAPMAQARASTSNAFFAAPSLPKPLPPSPFFPASHCPKPPFCTTDSQWNKKGGGADGRLRLKPSLNFSRPPSSSLVIARSLYSRPPSQPLFASAHCLSPPKYKQPVEQRGGADGTGQGTALSS
jgi:hypothetical protein